MNEPLPPRWQLRALSCASFATAALVSAATAWVLLGSEGDPLVYRAIASAALAGALIGLVLVRWLLPPAGLKRTLRLGALAGLALHLVLWPIFVLWSWAAAWLGGGEPLGTVWEGLLGAAVWSVGSATYGFVLTVPTSMLAAWLVVRAARPESE